MPKEVVDIFPCNLLTNNQKLYFEAGEYICYGCKGIGGHVTSLSFRKNQVVFQHCPVCKGTGKIDFILNILKNKEVKLTWKETFTKKSLKCSSCGNKNKNCKRLIKWARKNFKGEWIW